MEAELARAGERLTRSRGKAADAERALRAQVAAREAEQAIELRDEVRVTRAERAAAMKQIKGLEVKLATEHAELVETRMVSAERARELMVLRIRLDDEMELRRLGDPAQAEAARDEAAAARREAAESRAAMQAAESRALAAAARAREAEAGQRRAEAQAAREAAQRAAVQQATVGHDRKITKAELEELRKSGPAGPAVFRDAIRKVARANGRAELERALAEAASAALRWADRL